MSTPPDTPATPPQPRLFHWTVLVVTAAGALLLAGASGYVNGAVDGDFSWPAPSAEQVAYDAADALLWAGIAVAVIMVAAAAFAPRALSLVARIGLAAALSGAVFIAAAAVFLAAYGIGAAQSVHAISG